MEKQQKKTSEEQAKIDEQVDELAEQVAKLLLMQVEYEKEQKRNKKVKIEKSK